jgi:phosphate starvation-inducible PhoH-like protein
MIVTGDITQIDLPANVSGLTLASQLLGDMDDVHFATLTSADVVRHTLVAKIVDAYTLYEQKLQALTAARKGRAR